MTSLATAMAAGPVLLDGGLATQLEAQGHDLSSVMWSARLLVDEPGAIVEAHRRYFEAGARVAITSSYQASFEGLATRGLDRDEAGRLLRRSVDLACQARDEVDDGSPRWVAASIGPYGAALADGSEYRGDYGLDVNALRGWHRPRLSVLAAAGADVLALETIPCLAEVEALLAEIDGSGVPCWLSLTCDGRLTRAGEPVEEAFAMARDIGEVIAVGVNCTDASLVRSLVSLAASTSHKPAVAYPNSGEAWDAVQRRWTGPRSFAPEQVTSWVEEGARLIGGCCRVGPAEIAAMATSMSLS